MREDEYRFIAKMDSMGRLRVPIEAIEAKGFEKGMKFDVRISRIAKEARQ